MAPSHGKQKLTGLSWQTLAPSQTQKSNEIATWRLVRQDETLRPSHLKMWPTFRLSSHVLYSSQLQTRVITKKAGWVKNMRLNSI